MRSRTKISNVLPHPSQKYFIETALSLGFVKTTCKTDLFLFCQSTVSSPSVYVSVSSVTVDRLCQGIRCYISILNIQRTLIKLISLCSFNYEEHTNGFTTFNSFVLHSQQAQAGSLEDIKGHIKRKQHQFCYPSPNSLVGIPTLSFLLAWL